MHKELSKGFEPEKVEKRWYPLWENNKVFSWSGAKDQREKSTEKLQEKSFSIVIPPPNVTGVLHMGHALNSTLQDILVRYHRMANFDTLWIPGMDHAGIATQSVVEKKLDQQKISKYDLGREKFLEKVWEWKEEHGGIIQRQIREMGHSPDWDQERFTMDEGLSRAVRHVFVALYQEGLIYRGRRIINWCPKLRTALSDEEVNYQEIRGKLYYIKYPILGEGGFIEIATTRPETMLGDTAVAFHPEDERYRHLEGRKAILPLLGREIPFVADSFVDPSFGTGLVKVTPAHDPNDFEIGERHNLEKINILTPEGYITENGGPYQGLYRFEARKRIVADLENLGLMARIEDYTHSVGHCYRTGDVVEPYLTSQWFVKTGPLATPAIEVVKKGLIKFYPDNWKKTYLHWMENIRDWCISRQLWWGHRIPAWYCDDCGQISVSEEDVKTCEKCASSNVRQDEDVLDTWFSSALWPFSTMGWPDDETMVKKFYPTSVLVTAFDIIFFWVARMILMGLKFMKDVPFRDVLIHGLVLDEYGQKQSKSKGNVVNPLDMMYKYGTDAFRFTIAVASGQGRGIRWNEKNVSGYRNFANKIWNAARFIFMNFAEHGVKPVQYLQLPPRHELHAFDRWILGRYHNVLREMENDLRKYRMWDAASRVYDFIWKEFCDWYIEISKDNLKTRGNGEKNSQRAENTLRVLIFLLEKILKLLHPFMPFITEEIYSYIHEHNPEEEVKWELFIAVSSWPNFKEVEPFLDSEADLEIDLFREIVYRVRNIRGEMNIGPAQNLDAFLVPDAGDSAVRQRLQKIIDQYRVYIMSQAKLKEILILDQAGNLKNCAKSAIHGASLLISLEGIIDLAKERERIIKELGKLEKKYSVTAGKLANDEFLNNAPENVIEIEKLKLTEMADVKQRLQESLAALGE